MSSSPDTVVRGAQAGAVRLASPGPELRSGTWTRLGDSAVLGDGVTESALQSLADTTRAAARAQGYATGWAQGRRAGEEEALAEAERTAALLAEREAVRVTEHAQAVAALRRAADLLEESVEVACAAVESRTVDIALQLAEAVVGRELVSAADPGADAVRRALRLLPDGVPATIRLCPADHATLHGTAATGVLDRPSTSVVPDASLSRGDAVLETTDTVVDATVSSALARVREVLAP